jgi:hypothetical protein
VSDLSAAYLSAEDYKPRAVMSEANAQRSIQKKRDHVRRLMAEQSEFPIEIPVAQLRQDSFPWRKERLTRKILPFTAGAQ